ncbi:MAG: hypothetical protein WAL84_15835, partial [Candidatus Dormiibacterota bacterium]
FGANGARVSFHVMAYNLMRWMCRVGLHQRRRPRRRCAPATLLCRELVRHARQLQLHLPGRRPWAKQFQASLECLRSLPVAVSTPA